MGVDTEFHQVRLDAVEPRVAIGQPQFLPHEPAEVDQQVEPLGGRRVQACGRHGCRRGQQAGVGADQADRVVLHGTGFVHQIQQVEPRICGVEKAEAVPLRIDFQMRPDHPVDEVERSGEGGERAVRRRLDLEQQLPGEPAGRRVGVQVPVGDDQRDLAVAAGQAKCVLFAVAHQVHPGEPGVDVQPGDRHGVVVVPERHGVLGVRILDQLRAAPETRVVRPPVVLRIGAGAVQMRDGPRGQLRHAFDGWIAFAARPGGRRFGDGTLNGHERERAVDFVFPADTHALAAAHLDRRPREMTGIGPDG